jgi:hypothetical protein
MELFASEVMPEFAGRDADLRARRLDRLGDAPEKALARREPARTAPPDYEIKPGAVLH